MQETPNGMDGDFPVLENHITIAVCLSVCAARCLSSLLCVPLESGNTILYAEKDTVYSYDCNGPLYLSLEYSCLDKATLTREGR